MTAQKPLGKAGIAFFGSLCAGTFGLGVWQTKRYTEKVELLAKRDRDMALPPSSDVRSTVGRIQVRGTFDHGKEFLVGPRGSPLKQSNGSLGVPQHGYFVWAPFQLQHVETPSGSSSTAESVLINRGWVPREKVDGNRRSRGYAPDRGTHRTSNVILGDWDRPQGMVTITAVQSKFEDPRFLVPQHDDLSTRKLFWMDPQAMMTLSGVPMNSPLLTQIHEGEIGDNDLARPSVEQVAMPKVSPAIHAGYAVTWYGLSLAGVLLTRKLILRR